MPEPRVYPPHERPEVEVLVEGTWHYAVLRMWRQDDDTGDWHAQVTWSAPDGNRIDTFPADQVRQLEESPPDSPEVDQPPVD